MTLYRKLSAWHTRRYRIAQGKPVRCAYSIEEWEQIHASRPWWLKAILNTDIWLTSPYKGVFGYHLNPRRYKRAVQRRWQRSKRGWANSDAWSTDSYIARVCADMLEFMADNGHAYPGAEPWDTPEKWNAHLHDLAGRMRAWNDDTFTEQEAFEVTRAAMEEFGKNYGHYWD